MEFGKSATNFDRPHAESCPNGRRNAEPPTSLAIISELHALPPKLAGKRCTYPSQGQSARWMCLLCNRNVLGIIVDVWPNEVLGLGVGSARSWLMQCGVIYGNVTRQLEHWLYAAMPH